MPYVLRLDEGTQCILVYPSGQLSASDIDEALKEILALRLEKGVERILCDQRGLESAPSLPDIYNAAATFAEGPLRGMRLAIVRATMPQRTHFFETVAVNRSAAVRVFDDEDAARIWLAR